ncbi:MAG: hypothetical protein AN485_01035 [Anabaena sp. MDT14b]|jgi:uncharacterized membrane protein|nr:MAG: hypothetical protein AN485_01035 [Anabaena sp. MDT14b]
MNLETQPPIAKQNAPIWLKILVIFLMGLGIFFRFAHLGQKAIWYDEAFTALFIYYRNFFNLEKYIKCLKSSN